jgi:hypothetical protein
LHPVAPLAHELGVDAEAVELVGLVGHERPDLILRDAFRRTSVQMDDTHSRRPLNEFRLIHALPAAKHIDPVTVPGQMTAYLVDVHILTAGILTTDQCGRAGVLAYHCNPQCLLHY